MPLLIANARLLTLAGEAGPRRGAALSDLGILDRGWVRIDAGRITAVGAGEPRRAEDGPDLIDAGGCIVMPAFVDCHTHTCWAGSRLDEFERMLRGATYLEILQAGGGIMSTVRSVRATPDDELESTLVRRLARMFALGTGTVEVKSGYGLDTENELKMLRTIHRTAQELPQTIVGTFLGAHAIDPGNPRFIEETIAETLPAVVQEFPEIVCDAYCEKGAWSVSDTVRLFRAVRDLGCPLRVHADQFNSLGMTRIAVEMGAVSVDHLEAATDDDLRLLADSATMAVMMPASGFHLDERYAPARAFVDAGGALALATNCNPGSSPTPSMPFTIALACRKLRLSAAEAISCATWNAACVLGLQERVGSIERGKRADLQLLDSIDERDLAWEFATPGPLLVILGGHIVHARGVAREDGDEAEGEDAEEKGPETEGDDEDHDEDESGAR